MISFEKRDPGSIIENFEFDLSGNSLYSACKSINGFPSIEFKDEDDTFKNVLGLDSKIDEVSCEVFMSDIIAKCINSLLNGTSFSYPEDIPYIITYQLAKKYGLTPFSNFITQIQAQSKFVPPCIWHGSLSEINLKDLPNCFGTVFMCYNTNSVPKIQTYVHGPITNLPDAKVSVVDIEEHIPREGTEDIIKTDELTIPASYMQQNVQFTSKNNMFKNMIQTKNIGNTSGLFDSNGTLISTDGETISQINRYIGNYDSKTEFGYTMFKETNVSTFIKNFIGKNNLTNVIYNDFPIDRWIYGKPGDSSFIANGLKTILPGYENILTSDGDNVYVEFIHKCGNGWWFCSGGKTQTGENGKNMKYVNINGWYWNGGTEKYSTMDVETLKSSSFKIRYTFQKTDVKFRKGNILNENVYDIDRECYVGKWLPSSSNANIYLQNSYSYGKQVKLKDNSRTACLFAFANDIKAFSSDSIPYVKKLGKLGLRSYLIEVAQILQDNIRLSQFLKKFQKYIELAATNGLTGTIEESPFISFIVNDINGTHQTSLEEIVNKYGDEFNLIVSQSHSESTELLCTVNLPKLEIIGTNYRFSSSRDTDWNKYYIYGSKSTYSVRNKPIKINDNITISNTFIIHNNIFNKQCPNKLLNFNPWG